MVRAVNKRSRPAQKISQTGAIQQATSNPSRSNDDNDESARNRNIANLTEVIRHNPKDPRPLIERGAVYAETKETLVAQSPITILQLR